MTTHIIFLHGPSSVGKSTLARAVQDAAPVPFWHLSIDHFRDSGAWPMRRFRDGSLDWDTARARSFDGFHAMVGAAASAGNHLILEHILDTEGWDATLRDLLNPFDVMLVGLHCPLHDLTDRERQRGNRTIGSAARDFDHIHTNRRYDLELDTTQPISANTRTVLEYWSAGQRNSEFRDTASG